MTFKTTMQWLFNDICYSFTACFDGKIGVFQQTVVRVYYILRQSCCDHPPTSYTTVSLKGVGGRF